MSAEILMSTHYKKKKKSTLCGPSRSTCVVWRWCQGLTEEKAASVSASPSLSPSLIWTRGLPHSPCETLGDPASGSPPLSLWAFRFKLALVM